MENWLFQIVYVILGGMAGAILANQSFVVMLYDIPKLQELLKKKKLDPEFDITKLKSRASIWLLVVPVVAVATYYLIDDPTWFMMGFGATLLGMWMNVKSNSPRLEKQFLEKYKNSIR